MQLTFSAFALHAQAGLCSRETFALESVTREGAAGQPSEEEMHRIPLLRLTLNAR